MASNPNKNTESIHSQIQKNINHRLNGLKFRDLTQEEFDEDAGHHPDSQISFVQVDENTIDMYKGDTKIGSSGSGGGKYAVLYSDKAWGWVHKSSNEKTNIETVYDNETWLNKIKTIPDGTKPEDRWDIILLMCINPNYRNGSVYEMRFINAIWDKTGSMPQGYEYLLYDDSDTVYTNKNWHFCAYDSVVLNCEVANEQNPMSHTFQYTIMPGFVLPHTADNVQGSKDVVGVPFSGMDPYFDNIRYMSFNCAPIIEAREYQMGASDAEFRYAARKHYECSDYWFQSAKRSSENDKSTSKYRLMNYTRTYYASSADENYNREFGFSGIGVYFGPDDIEIEIEKTTDNNYYRIKKMKPELLLFMHDTVETVNANNVWSYTSCLRRGGTHYTEGNLYTSVYKLPEFVEDGNRYQRLGLQYDFDGNKRQDWPNDMRIGFSSIYDKMKDPTSNLPFYEMCQTWLEALYTIQKGREASASQSSS